MGVDGVSYLDPRVRVPVKHYGVKGMKKPTPPQKLDRVYRVAAGTASLRDRIQKAKKATAKKAKDDEKQNEEDSKKPAVPATAADIFDKGLIAKHGATRLADIG